METVFTGGLQMSKRAKRVPSEITAAVPSFGEEELHKTPPKRKRPLDELDDTVRQPELKDFPEGLRRIYRRAKRAQLPPVSEALKAEADAGLYLVILPQGTQQSALPTKLASQGSEARATNAVDSSTEMREWQKLTWLMGHWIDCMTSPYEYLEVAEDKLHDEDQPILIRHFAREFILQLIHVLTAVGVPRHHEVARLLSLGRMYERMHGYELEPFVAKAKRARRGRAVNVRHLNKDAAVPLEDLKRIYDKVALKHPRLRREKLLGKVAKETGYKPKTVRYKLTGYRTRPKRPVAGENA